MNESIICFPTCFSTALVFVRTHKHASGFSLCLRAGCGHYLHAGHRDSVWGVHPGQHAAPRHHRQQGDQRAAAHRAAGVQEPLGGELRDRLCGMNRRDLSVSTHSTSSLPAVESRPTASTCRTPSFFVIVPLTTRGLQIIAAALRSTYWTHTSGGTHCVCVCARVCACVRAGTIHICVCLWSALRASCCRSVPGPGPAERLLCQLNVSFVPCRK